MLLYKLAENKDPLAIYGQHIVWGSITIVIAWIPALAKTISLVSKMEWRQMSSGTIAKKVAQLTLLTLIWPVFSILL